VALLEGLLPRVDAGALMAQVNRIAAEPRAEAQRTIAAEGAGDAITPLRTEAWADAAVASQRLNLAVVVATLAGDAEAAAAVLAG